MAATHPSSVFCESWSPLPLSRMRFSASLIFCELLAQLRIWGGLNGGGERASPHGEALHESARTRLVLLLLFL
jgi:hypothetical protein